MTIQESMHDILQREARALLSIPYTPDYDRAVELIIEHVHRRGGKLVTAGMGKAGQIAMNIATTFSSTGTPAVNLHPSEAQHYPGIPLIGITGNPESELTRLTDVTLLTGGAPEVCPLGLTPTTSTTVMTVIGDILVVNVTRLIDFTTEEYAKRHHGGYLGHKSRKETGF